jgi:hypothetical protein
VSDRERVGACEAEHAGEGRSARGECGGGVRVWAMENV